MSVWIVVYLLFSAPFVVNPLLAQLEDQYSDTAACATGSHVVLLGGGVDSRLNEPTQFEFMSSSTLARAGAGSRLLKSEPETTVIVAGGALREISEASVIAAYLEAMGVEPARIIQEGRSANTRENAVNVAKLLEGEQLRGQLRLVTSALHMPRALQSFRRVLNEQGVEVCPVAVDFQALKNLPAWSWMPQTTTIVRFDKWLHEVIALSWYRHKGWI
ncbi:MAG: YdcF family protein [Granulosicoccus sp.]